MTSPVKARYFSNSPLIIYTLAVAFIFTLGFFIHFGKEARSSKSWGYVMASADDLFYWGVAKGRMMTPRCDGNPYYYEEQGLRHIIPCTTAEVVGLLSKYTGIPLSWFFPVWEILMPVYIWFFLTICCWKFWGCPLSISASGTLILLLSTLFRGYPEMLMRFPRNEDAMPLVFLWVTLIFKGDPNNKKHVLTVAGVSSIALWMHPYNVAFGLWITAFEYVHSLIQGEGFLKPRLCLVAMGSCLVSGLIYAGYLHFGDNLTTILLTEKPLSLVPIFYVSVAIFMFLFTVLTVLFFRFRLKKEVTALDRLVMEWTLWGVFICGVSALFPSLQEISTHMFYFIFVILFSLAGWIYEKLCILKEVRLFTGFSYVLALLWGALLLFSWVSRKDLLSAVNPHYFFYIAQYFFIFLFFIWGLMRFSVLREWVMRKKILWGVILLMTLAGYGGIPANEILRNYPFAGAHQWLNQHAQKNEVVLTASLKYRLCEYLILKTSQKSYFYLAGESDKNVSLRRDFVTGLLLGALDMVPRWAGWSLEQKLKAFRLDYILMPKPSPFYDAITTQLKGHLQEVYQDSQCLLWRVL